MLKMLKFKQFVVFVCAIAIVASTLTGFGKKTDSAAGGAQDSGVTGDVSVTKMLTAQELLDASWEEIEAQAKKEGEVTYLAWNEEAMWMKMKQAFEEKYPEIKMTVVIAEASKSIQKTLSEKDGDKGSFDLMMVGGSSIATVMDAELMAGPMVDKMEHKENLNQALCERQEGVPTKGFVVPIKTNQTGFLYNPNTVSNPPKTWEEFEKWIDENPQKFGFCIPEKGGSGQAFMQTLIGQLTGGLDQYYDDSTVDEVKHETWTAVWDWLNARKDKITFTVSNSDSLSRLNQGELDLVVAWDHNVTSVMDKGELFKDAEMYIPEFGMPGGGDTVGILKNAQHPAAAMLLMQYLISDEGQQLAMDEIGSGPARTDMVNEISCLSAEDAPYATAWIPSPYKTQFIKDFQKHVLMVQ